MLGWERAVAQDTYSHNQEGWIHGTFHARAGVADPGAGNQILITLDEDDLDDDSNFYPQAHDIVLFKNGVTGFVYSVDITTPAAPVLTIMPNQATDNIGAVTGGDEIVVATNAWGEATNQPNGRVSPTFEYENDCQIIKAKVGASGSELTRQIWQTVLSPDGTKIIGIFNKAFQIDLDYRMNLNISNALLVGRRTTNTNVVDPYNGQPILTTEGLIPYIFRVGNPFPIAAGAMDIDDVYTIVRTLAKTYSSNNVMLGAGIQRYQEIEKLIFATIKDTNATFVQKAFNDQLFKGNESLGVSINFKYAQIGNYNFGLKQLNDLHNPKTLGAANFPYENYALIVPLGTMKDPKTGEKVSTIGCRYREMGGYNRRLEFWNDGAAGNQLKIGEIDQKVTNARAHVGAHNACGEQMGIIYAP
jgi:hypothetical protein